MWKPWVSKVYICIFTFIFNPDDAGSIQFKQYKMIEWYKIEKSTELDTQRNQKCKNEEFLVIIIYKYFD